MSQRSPIEPASIVWPEASLPAVLAEDEVHVWAWTLGPDGAPVEEDLAILNEYERRRSARYHFAGDQVRYARCHANLRRILGSYVGCSPESLEFVEGSGGKPYLADQGSGATLFFNLSHSKTIALLGVVQGREIGVDVEDVRPIEAAVAERFFSAAEAASLRALSGPAWLEGFYRCWTRKESILKAEGEGLRIPLNAFDVSLTAEEAPALVAARPEARLTAEWRLRHLAPAARVMGALAVKDDSLRVKEYALATAGR